MSSRRRRNRMYTNKALLVRHEIRTIFEHPVVRQILQQRDTNRLRYSELQYLLCRERPKWSLVPAGNDADVDAWYSNLKSWQRDWIDAVENNRISRELRIYTKKSNFTSDLQRLDDKMLKRKDGYYWLPDSTPTRYLQESAKDVTTAHVNACPENRIYNDDRVFYLNVDPETWKDKPIYDKVHAMMRHASNELRNLWFNDEVRRIANTAQNVLNEMTSKEVKVRLWLDIKAHITVQSSNHQINIEEFDALLMPIEQLKLDLSKKEVARIEADVKAESRRYRDVNDLISSIMWKEKITSQNKAFDLLRKRGVIDESDLNTRKYLDYLKMKEKRDRQMVSLGLVIPFLAPSVYIC